MNGETNAASSKKGLLIRLPDERWAHIVAGHPELMKLRTEVLRTVADPARVIAGDNNELVALRPQSDGKVLVAIYRELADDGFVITAFLTRRLASLQRRTQLWPLPESTNF